MNIAIITLGCPKNITDTESLLAEFPEGYELSNLSESEIVLVNTCAFLKASRDEAYETLKSLKNKKVILLGCLTTQLKTSFFREYPQVKAIVSPVNYPHIANVIQAVIEGAEKIYGVEEEPLAYVEMNGKLLITPPSYAYIKIAEGCDNGCTFCLIPKLRGHYRSRPIESILSEAEGLIENGVKELILVAQDSGLYGFDLYKKQMLPKLLKKLSEIKGDFWIRVHYVYPERITDELLQVMSESEKICHYLDIPLQHGSPDILKAMKRPYDIDHTLNKIKKIRHYMPDIALRTSMIVGFPGETEENFNEFMDFLKRFNSIMSVFLNIPVKREQKPII